MNEKYETILEKVETILDAGGERDAQLQAICELLDAEVLHYDWVGFYLVEPGTRTLVLGPFVGEPTEHVRIPFGKGVCGQAAESEQTVVVEDVSAEDNYLSCSANVRSEMVVPIFTSGELAGELDIDSHEPSAFDNDDAELLERIASMVSELL